MTTLRKLGTAGLLTAASAALALSVAGTANADQASPLIFPTLQGCLTHGNQSAQQGTLHGFRCEEHLRGVYPEYWLIVTS